MFRSAIPSFKQSSTAVTQKFRSKPISFQSSPITQSLLKRGVNTNSAAVQPFKPKPTAIQPFKPKPTAIQPFKPKPTAVQTVKPKPTAVQTVKPKPTAVQTVKPKLTSSQAKIAALLKKPRRTATTAGPDMGALTSVDDPYFRSVMQPKPKNAQQAQASAQILANVQAQGHQSGKQRGVPPTPGSVVVPDRPGQGSDELSDEQLVHYSGLKGSKAPYNRGTDIVGVNKDLLHTIAVGTATTGSISGPPTLPKAQQAIDEGTHGLLDEVDLKGRKAHSVEAAFDRTAPGQNKYPVHGEMGVRGSIGPDNLGHRVSIPLSQMSPLERMLRGLAEVDESTPDKPKQYKINTKVHEGTVDPLTGQPVQIDQFTPDEE